MYFFPRAALTAIMAVARRFSARSIIFTEASHIKPEVSLMSLSKRFHSIPWVRKMVTASQPEREGEGGDGGGGGNETGNRCTFYKYCYQHCYLF